MIEAFESFLSHPEGTYLKREKASFALVSALSNLKASRTEIITALNHPDLDINYVNSLHSDFYEIYSVLSCAIRRGDAEILQLVLAKKPDLMGGGTRYAFRTALEYAKAKGNPEIIALIQDAEKERALEWQSRIALEAKKSQAHKPASSPRKEMGCDTQEVTTITGSLSGGEKPSPEGASGKYSPAFKYSQAAPSAPSPASDPQPMDLTADAAPSQTPFLENLFTQ